MDAEAFDAASVRRWRTPLLRWYRRHKRDLPWRRTSDPYAIWVSEVMLQQTTVAAVVPFWERFLRQFPDVPSLASAAEDDVLAAWSGLGYYARARALRAGAIEVMERHGGAVPAEQDRLESLPGVGRYTAGAIASVAYGRQVPVVDGNVKRVFARLLALASGAGARTERTMWAVASTLVRGRTPGDLNQALMELGATVCTPRVPRCPACPLERFCVGRQSGTPEAFPAEKRTASPRQVRVAAAWIVRNGRVLLARRHDGGIFRGTWDVPAIAVARSPGRELARGLLDRYGLAVRVGRPVAHVRHAILRTRLAIDVFPVSISGPMPRSNDLRWTPLKAIDAVPHSGATRKLVRAAGANTQKRSHDSRSPGPAAVRSSSAIKGRSKA